MRRASRTGSDRGVWARPAGLAALATVLAVARPLPAQDPELPGRGSLPPNIPSLLPDEQQLRSIIIDPTLRELADLLGHPVYHRREEAMQRLLEAPVEIAQLCGLLAEGSLAPEQRHRLLIVLKHRLLDAPRGAIGIRMRWGQLRVNGPGAVEIIDLLPGLPGEHVLRIGDRITHVDGHPLRSQNDLVVIVQTKRPGDPVTLDVERARRDEHGDRLVDEAGEELTDALRVTLELGSADLLRDPDTGQPTPAGRVETRRHVEAEEAARRYGPRPQRVQFQNGRTIDFLGSAVPDPLADELVDEHAAIRRLLRHRTLVDQGRITITRALRESWGNQLAVLLAQANQPGLSEPERRHLQRVVERYAELMHELERN